jgi:hypothetical protein
MEHRNTWGGGVVIFVWEENRERERLECRSTEARI